LRPLLSSGTVVRYPEFPEHHRILEHPLDAELELSISPGWDASVIDDLAALPIVTVHAEKPIGATLSGGEPDFGRFALDCRIASELGAELIVLHLWELPDGDRYLERNLDQLPALLDLAEEHSLTLAVETIPTLVGTPIDNVTHACERDDRCRVTLDIEFLALHGELERAPALGDRIAHVHAKDFDQAIWVNKPWNRYLIPGEGTVDVEGFLASLPFDGTVTLEASAVREDGAIDAHRVEKCLAWLRRLAA
jgi:sugar phosphate isomerase/epimerase